MSRSSKVPSRSNRTARNTTITSGQARRIPSAGGAPSLLAVLAHPDDEAFGPGAALARYADRGVRVYLACATRGEAGRRRGNPPARSRDELGAIRERELRSAADVLGITGVFLLGLPDGEVSRFDREEACRRLLAVFEHCAPDAVITFGPDGSLSPHPDHVAVSRLTTRVFFTLPSDRRPAGLYYYLSPWRSSPPPRYLLDRTVIAVDVSAYRRRRLEALRCHLTQVQQVSWLFGPTAQVAATFPRCDRFVLVYPRQIAPGAALDDLFSPLFAHAGLREPST